jgi:hypothetical protein
MFLLLFSRLIERQAEYRRAFEANEYGTKQLRID